MVGLANRTHPPGRAQPIARHRGTRTGCSSSSSSSPSRAGASPGGLLVGAASACARSTAIGRHRRRDRRAATSTAEVERADDRTEVGRLGAALNTMLGRIDEAFDERDATEATLRDSEERMRRFVADVSHELRTPLAAVQAYTELFDRGADHHPTTCERALRGIDVRDRCG